MLSFIRKETSFPEAPRSLILTAHWPKLGHHRLSNREGELQSVCPEPTVSAFPASLGLLKERALTTTPSNSSPDTARPAQPPWRQVLGFDVGPPMATCHSGNQAWPDGTTGTMTPATPLHLCTGWSYWRFLSLWTMNQKKRKYLILLTFWPKILSSGDPYCKRPQTTTR